MTDLTAHIARTTPLKDPQTLAAQRGSLLVAAKEATEAAQVSRGQTARLAREADRAWAALDAFTAHSRVAGEG